jgi:hypothetical protein
MIRFAPVRNAASSPAAADDDAAVAVTQSLSLSPTLLSVGATGLAPEAEPQQLSVGTDAAADDG